MEKYEPIFNRDALWPGDIVCRDSGGKAIMWATSTPESKTLWNHDAIFIPHWDHWAIGDALMRIGCQLTVPFEWESRAIREGHKLIVLRPAGATREQGVAAAQAWMDMVHGREYDKVAIIRLALKKLFGDWLPGQVGRPEHFFCSEGVAAAVKKQYAESPWRPATENETPGTTCRAWRNGQLVEPPDAFTEFGQQFRIRA